MTENTQLRTELLLNGEPYTGDPQCARREGACVRWKRRMLIGVLVIETCLALPKLAHGQFLGVFDSIFGSIQNDIGSSLSSINQIAQQMQKLYQTTVAPLAAINQARGFVANSINAYRSQMNGIFNTHFTSAVTPGPQQFESILHSRLSAQIPALQTSFMNELRCDPTGQCCFAARPRDDGRRRRIGSGESQNNLDRRSGAGRHSPDRRPDGKPGCGEHPRIQSIPDRPGSSRRSPLPGIHAEDACGGTTPGGRAHCARQRFGKTQDRRDWRNQQPHHWGADGSIKRFI